MKRITQSDTTRQGPLYDKLALLYPECVDCVDESQIFELLESKMRGFQDYAQIPCEDTGEPLVAIEQSNELRTRQIDPDMFAITGTEVFVRRTVANKLTRVANAIARKANLEVEVVYGYRDLSIQQKLFDMFIDNIVDNGFEGTTIELFEAAHRSIAVPSVAGHPTGGAVDLQLTREGAPLDMGTSIWDFDRNSYTFSPYISESAWQNRQLLRSTMTDAGFTPFDGEWWHFSYGDKEWAAANSEPKAIYAQIEYSPEMVQ